VIQIWAKNETSDGHRVAISKALDIINKVDKVSALDKSNPVFIEYKHSDALVCQYGIKALPAETKRSAICLKLVDGNTQCKASCHSLNTQAVSAAEMNSVIH